MDKPRLFANNGPNPSEGPGYGADEAAKEGEGKGTGVKGGEVKDRAAHNTPPPPSEPQSREERATRPDRRDSSRKRRMKRRQKRVEEGTERPHGGGRLSSLTWGGGKPHLLVFTP